MDFMYSESFQSICGTATSWRNVVILLIIRVAMIFSGVHFFPEKVDDLFIVAALKTQAG